jgi:hypothetical protein
MLANLVLVLHVGYVLFVVGGLACVWVGALFHWSWIRNFWFRVAHLAAIGLVVVESILGWLCPLTVLEDELRGGSPESSQFIARSLHRLLFWDLPGWAFTAMYIIFGALVVATWMRVPPRSSPKFPPRRV